jgi:thiol:disulfide interchange protein DsbD
MLLFSGAGAWAQVDDPFAAANQANARPAAKDDDPFALANRMPDAPAPRAARKNPTDDRIDFQVAVTPERAWPGEMIQLTITGTPRPGYHTYPLTQRSADPAQDASGLSVLKYQENPAFKPLWPVTESPPEFDFIPGVGAFLEHKKKFTWTQDILVAPDAKPGPKTLGFTIRLQVCNGNCVWGEHHFEPTVEVLAGAATPLTAQLQERLQAKPPDLVAVPVPASPGGVTAAQAESPQGPHAGLVAFMLTGVFWGAVSLITPCVFPMIPITVSFFLKQSEKQHHRPVTMATVYCLTIVVVLTIAAVSLLSFFREWINTPIMNFGLGALFGFFALSLFGMYEIELPTSLAQFTSAREGKGGLVGTMFMALTFTIISFACVAPFLGGFGGTAATAQLTWLERVLGGLAFSVTFASPFFVLALFPTLLKQLPKSGNWLNSVKVVMGFLELAAALKFFRAGELLWRDRPEFFTYDLVLGAYVALSFLCGLYLLNLYRLPHDTPSEHLSVPQLLFSLAFLSLGLYLTPALFKNSATGQNQRPSGAVFAWLDSFLLPEPEEESVLAAGRSNGATAAGRAELHWVGNLKQGLEDARTQGKLVFLDFTGETCTNCKINEANVFPKPAIKELLSQYSLVQLYTDKVPSKFYTSEERARFSGSTERQRADAATNLDFQRSTFNTEQLPLYVILEPLPGGAFREVDRYAEGKINDLAGFTHFLQKPLAARNSGSRAEARGS